MGFTKGPTCSSVSTKIGQDHAGDRHSLVATCALLDVNPAQYLADMVPKPAGCIASAQVLIPYPCPRCRDLGPPKGPMAMPDAAKHKVAPP